MAESNSEILTFDEEPLGKVLAILPTVYLSANSKSSLCCKYILFTNQAVSQQRLALSGNERFSLDKFRPTERPVGKENFLRLEKPLFWGEIRSTSQNEVDFKLLGVRPLFLSLQVSFYFSRCAAGGCNVRSSAR